MAKNGKRFIRGFPNPSDELRRDNHGIDRIRLRLFGGMSPEQHASKSNELRETIDQWISIPPIMELFRANLRKINEPFVGPEVSRKPLEVPADLPIMYGVLSEYHDRKRSVKIITDDIKAGQPGVWEDIWSSGISLDRASECIRHVEQDLKSNGLFDEKSEHPEQGTNNDPPKPPENISDEARVLAVFADNPRLSKTDIAKLANVHRPRLYEMPKYLAALAAYKEGQEQSYLDTIPHGTKDAETGHMEAYEK